MEDIKGRVLCKTNYNCNSQSSTSPEDEQLSYWTAIHCIWHVEQEGPAASVPLQEVRKVMLVYLTTQCVSVGWWLPCPNLSDDIPHCKNQTIQFVLLMAILCIQAIKCLDLFLCSLWDSFPCVCLITELNISPSEHRKSNNEFFMYAMDLTVFKKKCVYVLKKILEHVDSIKFNIWNCFFFFSVSNAHRQELTT